MSEGDTQSGRQGGFTWAKVDRDLVQALVLAKGSKWKRAMVKAKLESAPDEAVRRAAADVLGRAGFPLMRDIVDVLRDEWLRRPGSEVETAIRRIARDVEEQVGIAVTPDSAQGIDRQRAFLFGLHRNAVGWSTFERSIVREFRNAHRRDLGSRATRRAPTAGEPLLAEITLQGARARESAPEGAFKARPYQTDTWANLDKLARGGRPLRALVRLPTGAGKTDVAVRWIVGRLGKDPKLKVLWLSHQVFLLEQAAMRFETVVESTQPPSFERELRIFSHGRSELSQLHEHRTDVALATINAIAAALKQPRWSSRYRYIRSFLHSPLIVVIDEAHHAGNNSYTRILREIDKERAASEPRRFDGSGAQPPPRPLRRPPRPLSWESARCRAVGPTAALVHKRDQKPEATVSALCRRRNRQARAPRRRAVPGLLVTLRGHEDESPTNGTARTAT